MRQLRQQFAVNHLRRLFVQIIGQHFRLPGFDFVAANRQQLFHNRALRQSGFEFVVQQVHAIHELLFGFEIRNQLLAKFNNIGSLKVRAPVKVAGVLVGRVSEIRYDNERFQAEVVFTVDSRYKFPTDTFANILTSGLLGEQYLGLDPGGEEKTLAPGDVIRKTQSAVVLEKLISQFMFNKAAEGEPAPAK